MERQHLLAPSSGSAAVSQEQQEGEKGAKAPSSSEEGVGGGEVTSETLKARARAMRNSPTEPEKRLWMVFRDSRFAGFKFRRQDVIGQRIVDFFCPARGLVIEVDGHSHDAEADAARDERMLRDFGFATVRFANADVMQNLEGCLMRLQDALEAAPARWAGRVRRYSRHHPPAPSSEEEGET
jgi:very-short-patch-repair endonuclease